MTGFGAAEGEVAGRRVRVEIRAVNHRFFNLVTRLPGGMSGAAGELREALRREFDRGHVNVQVRWADDAVASASIDIERAEAVVAALRALQERFGLGGEVSVDLVARQAEVFGLRRTDDDSPIPWSAVAPVVVAAAADCRAARRREGAALAQELADRLAALEAGAERIAAEAPRRLVRERDRLAANVRQLLDGATVDEGRLITELAVAADRLDLTEELVRFRAHVAAARDALLLDQPVGKQLGFLAQEMGREVNTMGSKANDALIAHEVVAMKGELEKVREQLENLE
ncbi:MAG: YicC/YloC family endoribonuclease [Gemmatimonadota bacterium]